MKNDQRKELINCQGSIAIVRYFEWLVFSKDFANTKYLLLRVNKRHKGIYEIEIPNYTISFLISKLDGFEEVFRREDGVVWAYGFSGKDKRTSTCTEDRLFYKPTLTIPTIKKLECYS